MLALDSSGRRRAAATLVLAPSFQRAGSAGLLQETASSGKQLVHASRMPHLTDDPRRKTLATHCAHNRAGLPYASCSLQGRKQCSLQESGQCCVTGKKERRGMQEERKIYRHDAFVGWSMQGCGPQHARLPSACIRRSSYPPRRCGDDCASALSRLRVCACS